MSTKPLLLLLVAAAIALHASTPKCAIASDCTRDSTGLVPLMDLGPGSYLGAQGGLYPLGSNQRPPAHTAAGISIANAITPLDTLGSPDPNGRIVLISIGMSNTTQEFQAFIPKANAASRRNPRVLIVDCAVGGQAANVIRNPNAAYWDSVSARLSRAGSSNAQVQVVWLKEANASPTGAFPASSETLRTNLTSIVRILKQKLPNVRLAYLTSRIYAGYATTNLNPEPYAYESGFAVKWLIESQIRGDSLNYDSQRGPVEAPWLSWGPYLWADGMQPRSDGLTWPCSYFAADGTHPALGARNLVADSLLAFFERDSTTTPWFITTVTAVSEAHGTGRRRITRVYPVPASRVLSVDAAFGSGGPGTLRLYSASGMLVASSPLPGSTTGTTTLRLDVSRLPSGVYYLDYREERDSRASIGRRIVIAR